MGDDDKTPIFYNVQGPTLGARASEQRRAGHGLAANLGLRRLARGARGVTRVYVLRVCVTLTRRYKSLSGGTVLGGGYTAAGHSLPCLRFTLFTLFTLYSALTTTKSLSGGTVGVTPPPVTACCFYSLLFTLYFTRRSATTRRPTSACPARRSIAAAQSRAARGVRGRSQTRSPSPARSHRRCSQSAQPPSPPP